MKELDTKKINKIMIIIFSVGVLISAGLLGFWAHLRQTKTPKEITPLTISTAISCVLTLVTGVATGILNQIVIRNENFSKTHSNKEDVKNEE